MDKMDYEIEEVHISTIQAGDTILHTDGLIRTVCEYPTQLLYGHYSIW